MELTLSPKSIKKSTAFKDKFEKKNVAQFMGGDYSFTSTVGKGTKKKGKTVRSKAKDVTTKATKIAPLEQSNAMADMLSKILTFMQKTHDDEQKSRELLNNYQEENDLEAAKRHKALLEALKNIKISSPPKEEETAEKIEQETGQAPVSVIQNILDAFGGAKSALGLLGNIGKFFLFNPIGLALLAGAGMLTLLAMDKNPEATTKSMLDTVDPAAVGREIMSANEQLGEQSPEDYNKMLEERRVALKDAPLATRFYGSEKTQREYLQSIGKKPEEINQLFSDTRKREPKPIVGATPEAAAKARSTFAQTDERMKAVSAPTPTMSPPEVPSIVDTGEKLSTMSSENAILPLLDNVKEEIITNVNNMVNSGGDSETASIQELHFVRNQEPTFMRMIYQSTRVI